MELVLIEVHERIREVRSIIGLSQAKFAKRIAVSPGYLAEIELNNRKVTERIIKLIVSEFNVNGYWLRTGEGEIFDDGLDNQIIRLISGFKSMTPLFKNLL